MLDKSEPKDSTPVANKYYRMAMDINAGKSCREFLYCMEEDKFYQYRDGVWSHIFEVDFLGLLEYRMPKMVSMPLVSRKQVMENFKTIARQHMDRFNWHEMINLENTMLNPHTGETEPHRPDFYSTNRLPFAYDPEAKCDLWLKTMDEIFEGNKEKLDSLQEFFGYCLTRDTKQHKALLLTGESRTGKSTILNTLRNVIGTNNCSSVPIKYISNPQYTPMLINKLVNIDTDVSSKASEYEAEFKTITSGEPVQTNQKYIAAFDFVPYCKIVMAANIFPKITDHSSAFYNRLILLPCDRVFTPEEQNRDLPKQLMVELPGILNWAMAGLGKLRRRGRFEEKVFIKEAIQELEDENNPSNLFFEEHIEVKIDTVTYIEKGELFEKYKTWCDRTKNYVLSQARFASCVFKKYHKSTPKNARIEGSGKRIWRCLYYVEQKTPQGEGKQIGWQE